MTEEKDTNREVLHVHEIATAPHDSTLTPAYSKAHPAIENPAENKSQNGEMDYEAIALLSQNMNDELRGIVDLEAKISSGRSVYGGIAGLLGAGGSAWYFNKRGEELGGKVNKKVSDIVEKVVAYSDGDKLMTQICENDTITAHDIAGYIIKKYLPDLRINQPEVGQNSGKMEAKNTLEELVNYFRGLEEPKQKPNIQTANKDLEALCNRLIKFYEYYSNDASPSKIDLKINRDIWQEAASTQFKNDLKPEIERLGVTEDVIKEAEQFYKQELNSIERSSTGKLRLSIIKQISSTLDHMPAKLSVGGAVMIAAATFGVLGYNLLHMRKLNEVDESEKHIRVVSDALDVYTHPEKKVTLPESEAGVADNIYQYLGSNGNLVAAQKGV